MCKLQISYILHILEECTFIISTTKDVDKNDFLKNEIMKRAIVRSIEIIGEATKKTDIDFKKKWNEIEWKQLAGMRDKLIHDYFGINYNIVWDVAKNKIPQLKIDIEKIIKNEEKYNQKNLF
ncbi:MAG: DUF86 domain-containing protein [Bacteroidales bacterium]|jgi:uncharacterized protein with HEPN domain